MNNQIRRIFVEKKQDFDVEAKHLYKDIKTNLSIKELDGLRILHRYDIQGIDDEVYEKVKNTIFSEPNVDHVYDEDFPVDKKDQVFAIEYLPGQYDQRADSAEQCVQIFTQKNRPKIATAKVMVLKGNMNLNHLEKIKNYCINPVDSREASLDKIMDIKTTQDHVEDVPTIDGFMTMDEKELKNLSSSLGFAMSFEDLCFCQKYFQEEKRNPTLTELKVIDTYWSDHCRHTTFATKIEDVTFEEGKYIAPIQASYESYLESRKWVYEERKKDICLMDLATLGMKKLRKQGKLNDLEVSDEINAASIEVDVDVNGENQKWLVMFKNETHNHPTEIEPFGGAATCLGGAIRDPLSGRSYVYQAMRVSGSGDPRQKIDETLPGKLPQRKITIDAASGYSSYGNQIGLATGQVAEVYDEGFVAKRMEVGAVIAAAPKENVVRKMPQTEDVIVLVGGRTGRDGCGGATGSSKEHTEESILNCGAEVQKGNPPTERKLQRLFRNRKVSQMIKKCNDFGAGGVSVAIGELADSLLIDLDAVPKKYEGLDGTELAISESQERMAVVIDKENVEKFISFAHDENVEAVVVAVVTDDGRLRMKWRDQTILDLKRSFLDSNGVKQKTSIYVKCPDERSYFDHTDECFLKDLEKKWIHHLKDINIASQKGLVERFDSTIGGATVLMPFGGKYQMTPAEGMVSKIPVLEGETQTGTIMTYGYYPKIGKWSPFHGAMYAVIESIAKVVCLGGKYENIRLTLQEYFEKLGKDPQKWGKPFSALLGAWHVQNQLQIPAIGGKDSMSGTFNELHVPPTLVSFAVNTVNVAKVVSQELKQVGSVIVYIPLPKDEKYMPDFDILKKNYTRVHDLIESEKVLSAQSIRNGGMAEALSKMSFGNRIGVKIDRSLEPSKWFMPDYGSIILEIDEKEDVSSLLEGIDYEILGKTQEKFKVDMHDTTIDLTKALEAFEEPLEKVFPSKESTDMKVSSKVYTKGSVKKSSLSIAKPKVFIPVFPGTNCEYDTAKIFEKYGAEVETLIFKNLTSKDIEDSIESMVESINRSQIVALAGGFSAGDEPDGSGKFIATVFRNPFIEEAVMKLLNQRDGLMLGICNGFQALIKLGLLPYGKIMQTKESAPTLTFNNIGRHISSLVRTKVVSNLSPWLQYTKVSDIHTVAVSHGEGRFIASEEEIKKLMDHGQITTQYVDLDGNPTSRAPYNPNGSIWAVEGITSKDGRILGKMGHTERMNDYVAKNVKGNKDQSIFKAGIDYFK